MCRAVVIRAGITPAGAGKTIAVENPVGFMKDHPRRCGENNIRSAYLGNFAGSPPQVRGKLHFGYSAILPIRITPAGAGKTC